MLPEISEEVLAKRMAEHPEPASLGMVLEIIEWTGVLFKQQRKRIAELESKLSNEKHLGALVQEQRRQISELETKLVRLEARLGALTANLATPGQATKRIITSRTADGTLVADVIERTNGHAVD